MPAYIYNFSPDDDNTKLIKIIDGTSGKIVGDKVYSPFKTMLVGGIIGIIITPIFGAFGGIGSIGLGATGITFLLSRSLIGGVVAAVPAGFWSMYSHKLTKMMQNGRKEVEIHENQQYDKSANFNNPNNSNSSNSFYKFTYNVSDSLDEKYILLGLNPSKKKYITCSDLREGYYKQLRKWHPDVYNGDKTVANDMTIKIKEAFNELESVTKNT
jgi:hypothetical protein